MSTCYCNRLRSDQNVFQFSLILSSNSIAFLFISSSNLSISASNCFFKLSLALTNSYSFSSISCLIFAVYSRTYASLLYLNCLYSRLTIYSCSFPKLANYLSRSYFIFLHFSFYSSALLFAFVIYAVYYPYFSSHFFLAIYNLYLQASSIAVRVSLMVSMYFSFASASAISWFFS